MWEEHFSNLGKPPQIADNSITPKINRQLPINTEDFRLEELNACLKSLKRNKTPGPANMNVEIWKTKALSAELLNVCNKVYDGDNPDIWHKSCTVPVPVRKKGNLGQASKY